MNTIAIIMGLVAFITLWFVGWTIYYWRRDKA